MAASTFCSAAAAAAAARAAARAAAAAAARSVSAAAVVAWAAARAAAAAAFQLSLVQMRAGDIPIIVEGILGIPWKKVDIVHIGFDCRTFSWANDFGRRL